MVGNIAVEHIMGLYDSKYLDVMREFLETERKIENGDLKLNKSQMRDIGRLKKEYATSYHSIFTQLASDVKIDDFSNSEGVRGYWNYVMQKKAELDVGFYLDYMKVIKNIG